LFSVIPSGSEIGVDSFDGFAQNPFSSSIVDKKSNHLSTKLAKGGF
jgi:hypothetical protein